MKAQGTMWNLWNALFRADAPDDVEEIDPVQYWLSYDPVTDGQPDDRAIEQLDDVLFFLRGNTMKLSRIKNTLTGKKNHGRRWTKIENMKLIAAFKRSGHVKSALKDRSSRAQKYHLTKLLMERIAAGKTPGDLASEFGHPVDLIMAVINPMHNTK
jgi:hypothetical protein